MIPKIIHYVWLGDKKFGDLENMCLESWRKYMPDYKKRASLLKIK